MSDLVSRENGFDWQLNPSLRLSANVRQKPPRLEVKMLQDDRPSFVGISTQERPFTTTHGLFRILLRAMGQEEAKASIEKINAAGAELLQGASSEGEEPAQPEEAAESASDETAEEPTKTA